MGRLGVEDILRLRSETKDGGVLSVVTSRRVGVVSTRAGRLPSVLATGVRHPVSVRIMWVGIPSDSTRVFPFSLTCVDPNCTK